MKTFRLSNDEKEIILYSPASLAESIIKELPQYERKTITKEGKNLFRYSFKSFPSTCFVIKALLVHYSKHLSADSKTKEFIIEQSKMSTAPVIFAYQDTHVGIECPGIPYYLNIVQELGALERNYSLYTVPFSRAFEVLRIVQASKSFLPPFEFDDSIKKVFHEPLKSFNGKLPSLFDGDIEDLYTVNHAYQAKPDNFRAVGYNAPIDFLFQRPRRYIDKTASTDFKMFYQGEEVTLIGEVVGKEVVNFKHAKFSIRLGSENGKAIVVEIMYWQRRWMIDKFRLGDEVLVVGKFDRVIKGIPTFGGNSMESLLEAKSLPIVPIYPQSSKNKITSKAVMNTVYELLARLEPYKNKLAAYISPQENMYHLGDAIRELHFPESIENYKKAIDTLAFYELIYLQLLILHRQETEEKAKGLPKNKRQHDLVSAAAKSLPYDLTGDQVKACKQIFDKMSTDTAEQMLLSADVGAGKTLVAQLACLQAVDAGFQAVLVGPTDILAQQLYRTFVQLLAGIPGDIRPNIIYLSGKLKAKERREVDMGIASGAINIIVGTHSALSNKVPYRNLGFVCIDEQQKFGAAQRESLLNSRGDEFHPDILTQTATPIPRSTAQIYYGDIDLVTIEEKPAGRKDIKTVWLKEEPKKLLTKKTAPIWKDILSETDKGHQAFFVVPMVHENPKYDAASVEDTYKKLKALFPTKVVEYVHGQMKKDEQDAHMENFRSGKADILVGSTVVEVGVDVPNATRMVILSADRLGASSLHQIRGRVGRSDLPSACYLVSVSQTNGNIARLESLVASNNGFEIAMTDLRTRGEGDVLGIKQSGDSSRKFASLIDHSQMIDIAREEAVKIYNSKHKKEALLDAQAVVKREED